MVILISFCLGSAKELLRLVRTLGPAQAGRLHSRPSQIRPRCPTNVRSVYRPSVSQGDSSAQQSSGTSCSTIARSSTTCLFQVTSEWKWCGLCNLPSFCLASQCTSFTFTPSPQPTEAFSSHHTAYTRCRYHPSIWILRHSFYARSN